MSWRWSGAASCICPDMPRHVDDGAMTERTGRIVLCCGMVRAASTLQYQLAIFAAERGGPTVARGWYDGTPLPELLHEVPDGQTWVYKIHGHRAEYRFEEATTGGRVIGLSTWRDLRKVISSYRELHSKSMWWVARHRVLETTIRDHRRWSEAPDTLMQSYEELTGSTASALVAIADHLGVTLTDEDLAAADSGFDRDTQRARTVGRGRNDGGVARPADLLQANHVAAHERVLNRDLDTAWVESIAGRWLEAHGLALTAPPWRRALARLRYAPRWVWFLRWHLVRGSAGAAAARSCRRARSWARYGLGRLRLTDMLMRRAVARRRAARRRQEPGTTVVMVSWNSEAIIDDTLRIVRRNSPTGTRVLVVDNGSVDATCDIVARHPDVDLLPIGRNVGHGLAMDLGFLAATTEYCLALDVDAFPIRPGWIDDLRSELDQGAVVAGAQWHRHVGFYIHPCCLLMRRRRFIEKRHSFETRFLPGVNPAGAMGVHYWDTGEHISMREGEANLAPVPMTESTRKAVGMVFGDLVYHNGATTRAADADGWADDGGVDGALDLWRGAVARFDPVT